MFRRSPRRPDARTPLVRAPAPGAWNRRRLQLLLALGISVVLAVVAAGVWSVASVLRGDEQTQRGETPWAAGERLSPEDRLAASPMTRATLRQAQGGVLSSTSSSAVVLPGPGAAGDVGVIAGFPATPEGALAQLIEIDRRALESTSVVTAQQVIRAWAAPGGPTPQTWSGVRAMAQMLTAAGLPADGSEDLRVTLRPAMGLIKGSVGDVVVSCVDFVMTVTATGASPQRVAVADCQRMTWDGDRWLIGAGDEPAPPPSIWPGTDASYDAGYRWLEASP